MTKGAQVEDKFGSPFDPQGTGVLSDTGNRSVRGSGSVGTINTAVEPAASTSDFGPEQAGAMKQQERCNHF